jgi:hypothetical protein
MTFFESRVDLSHLKLEEVNDEETMVVLGTCGACARVLSQQHNESASDGQREVRHCEVRYRKIRAVRRRQ